MESSRKRPHTDDGDISVAKKRVLTSSNGTPHVNGTSDQTEDDQLFSAGLENFRKEAIYRRMRHYSRENERNLARIADLERRKTTCEAGLAAMSACWSHLIETIRLLVNADSLSSDDIKPNDIFRISERMQEDDGDEESIPQLKSALGEAAKATEALVAKFAHIGAERGSTVLSNEAYEDCQKAKAECAVLRSELQMTRNQLRECTESRDKYHSELQAAQNRVERSQSQTVQQLDAKQSVSKASSVAGDAEDTQRKPPSPSDSPDPSAIPQPVSQEDSEIARASLEMRDLEIQRVNSVNTKLVNEIAKLKAEMEGKNYSPPYRITHAECDKLRFSYDTEVRNLNEQLGFLKASRIQWEKDVTASAEKTISELKSMLSKRDSENTRLREQREQHLAELNERKQRDLYKFSSLAEWKHLAEARGERVRILQSELRRWKGRVAASEGREDLMLLFVNGDKAAADLISQLKADNEQLEVELTALRDALSIYSQETPDIAIHVKAHAEAEEKATRLNAELAQLKKVTGDLSQLPPDVAELMTKVKTQHEEMERLRLVAETLKKDQGPIEEELTNLTNCWEAADKKIAEEVFNLTTYEDRMQKTLDEKGKADTKYYSISRAKLAIDAERKQALDLVEKHEQNVINLKATLDLQFQTINQHVESLVKFEKEIAELKKDNNALSSELANVRSTIDFAKYCQQKKDQEYAKFKNDMNDMNNKKYQERTDADKTMKELKANLEKTEKELQALKVKNAEGVVSKHGRGSKDDGEYQHLRSLLLCSTCGSNFRSVIITKCMHTFCKPCVDSRISTRQRKCPACNVQFGVGDVSTLYMQ